MDGIVIPMDIFSELKNVRQHRASLVLRSFLLSAFTKIKFIEILTATKLENKSIVAVTAPICSEPVIRIQTPHSSSEI